MGKVEVNVKGIKNRLKDIKPYRAIAEYVWNGFDSGASTVDINYECLEMGNIYSLTIKDNGRGIPYQLLEQKFKPVLSSEKRDQQVTHTLVHGKNGLGRLTFFHFSEAATWETTCEDGGSFQSYSITVSESNIDHYDPSEIVIKSEAETGTSVIFKNIFGLSDYDFKSNIQNYLKKEFAWFLELKKASGFVVNINGSPLEYLSLIKDVKDIQFRTADCDFEIRYIRWARRLNAHFSRFYCSTDINTFRYSKPTTLNNQGDEFFHSVFISSKYFDDFIVGAKETQPDFLSPNTDQSDDFRSLVNFVNSFLRERRKPFIVDYAKTLVDEYEKNGIFPSYNSQNRWEIIRAEDLKEAVAQLYQVEPKIFSNLNIPQKKTLVGFISLIIDGGEIADLFNVLDGIISLSPAERESFSRNLQSTKMSSIVKTIELITDRFTSVAEFKRLVFDPLMYAGEVPHLQKMMEKNYWLIGEEYQLLTSAEPDFEEALRRFLYVLHGVDKKQHIDHKNKNKEMDLFLVRQGKKFNYIENIVIELKHPENVRLGKKQIDQVYEYFNLVKAEPRFNASNMKWKFYLIGNRFDESGYLESMINALKHHGEPGLVFTDDAYKVYVYKWSEVFNEFELKHGFLQEKLSVERDRLIELHHSANDIVSRVRSSDANPEIVL